MPNWYLNITKLPQIDDDIVKYIESLKPYKACQWGYTSKAMKQYKKELLDELLVIQDNRCVYCGLSFNKKLIDREHFAPKGQTRGNPEFMFEPHNLFAACGDCNRKIKGQKPTISKYDATYKNCTFKIIHPYLENPEDYIEYKLDSKGRPTIIKAKPGTGDKGIDTIKFFKLATALMLSERRGYLASIEDEDEDEDEEVCPVKSGKEVKKISNYKGKGWKK